MYIHIVIHSNFMLVISIVNDLFGVCVCVCVCVCAHVRACVCMYLATCCRE